VVILDKVCGEANRAVFVGFTDLFQQIICGFIPNFWPFSVMEDIFNQTFDFLQEQMKPFAYDQGFAMGKDIEDAVTAWIKSQFDTAIAELEKVKREAQRELEKVKREAQRELAAQQAKIQNLLDRVAALEGISPQKTGILHRSVV